MLITKHNGEEFVLIKYKEGQAWLYLPEYLQNPSAWVLVEPEEVPGAEAPADTGGDTNVNNSGRRRRTR